MLAPLAIGTLCIAVPHHHHPDSYYHCALHAANTMGVELLYSGFETCFGPSTQRAWTKTHLKSRFCVILKKLGSNVRISRSTCTQLLGASVTRRATPLVASQQINRLCANSDFTRNSIVVPLGQGKQIMLLCFEFLASILPRQSAVWLHA